MESIKIVFQGDSITDGNRYKAKEEEWDKNHQIGHSYVYIINGILGSKYPEKYLEFVNRGISGNRIIDIYGRVDNDIIDLKPDILSMLVGVNDLPSAFNCKTGTSSDKYNKLYRMMLDEVKANNPKIKLVLCEPFILPVNKAQRDYDTCTKLMAAYQEKVAQIAADYEAIFVPLQAEFNSLCKVREAEYWSWDGIHPTENGHGIIAEKWIAATQKLF